MIDGLDDLFALTKEDFISLAEEATTLKDYPPTFEHDHEDEDARYN